VNHLTHILLILFLIQFFLVLVMLVTALFLLRPAIPLIEEGSPVMVLVSGIDYFWSLLRRVSQLLIRVVRLTRSWIFLLLYR